MLLPLTSFSCGGPNTQFPRNSLLTLSTDRPKLSMYTLTPIPFSAEWENQALQPPCARCNICTSLNCSPWQETIMCRVKAALIPNGAVSILVGPGPILPHPRFWAVPHSILSQQLLPPPHTDPHSQKPESGGLEPSLHQPSFPNSPTGFHLTNSEPVRDPHLSSPLPTTAADCLMQPPTAAARQDGVCSVPVPSSHLPSTSHTPSAAAGQEGNLV